MASHSSSEFAIPRDEDVAASNDASQLDSAGQAILKLLHKAAGAAEANSRRALETAQKLSSQLRAADPAQNSSVGIRGASQSRHGQRGLRRLHAKMGSPKAAIMASPMNLSSMPASRTMHSTISAIRSRTRRCLARPIHAGTEAPVHDS